MLSVNRGGKGSHGNFVHPKVFRPVTIAGNLGDEADRYKVPGPATGHRGSEDLRDSARYVKVVEWSDEDQCFIGSSPGLFYGGCDGPDEMAIFDEACQIVEEVIELYKEDGKPLPAPTAGRDFANMMQGVA